jgi:hypothetical protein
MSKWEKLEEVVQAILMALAIGAVVAMLWISVLEHLK